jgi:TolA-binding protein
MWLALTTTVLSCAYYNGLFNANRLAADAERAERDGRSGEARSLWAQAAVKAESVATRYPGSGHRDDALLLWGRAMYEVRNCRAAVEPLVLAVDSSPDRNIQREARLYLGQCHVELRQPDSAIAVLEPLLADSGSEIAAQAVLLKGRAELSRGRYDAAVEDLQRVPIEEAAFDLARAYLSLRQLGNAVGVLEERVPGWYEEDEWLVTLDSVGVQDLQAASAMVDQLTAKRELTTGQRARLLLADGRRWSEGRYPSRAAAQFSAAAATVGPDSAEARLAEAYLAIAELRGTQDLDRLVELRETLELAVRRGSGAIPTVALAALLVDHAVTVLEDPDTSGADLRMFIVAEEFRDSLGAAAPAVALFLRLERDYPQSVVAPKALLAAAVLDPGRGERIRQILQDRYPDSPYTLVLAGLGSDRFSALEDSLRTMLAAARTRMMEGGDGERGGDIERDRE